MGRYDEVHGRSLQDPDAFWGEAGSRGVYLERVGSIDNVYLADLENICADLARRGGYKHLEPKAAALGLVAIVSGLVLALRRRDYRIQQRRYGADFDEQD